MTDQYVEIVRGNNVFFTRYPEKYDEVNQFFLNNLRFADFACDMTTGRILKNRADPIDMIRSYVYSCNRSKLI